jgi:hypothetical protein
MPFAIYQINQTRSASKNSVNIISVLSKLSFVHGFAIEKLIHLTINYSTICSDHHVHVQFKFGIESCSPGKYLFKNAVNQPKHKRNRQIKCYFHCCILLEKNLNNSQHFAPDCRLISLTL